MIDINILKDTETGKCLVIGHGESIKDYDWKKVKDIPKFLVNFYDPKIENIVGIVCWDKDILKEVFFQRIYDEKPDIKIYYSGIKIEQVADVFLDPKKFVPSKKHVFSGQRVIYLSQFLGYNEIYLVGFDFIPHITDNYLVQRNEIIRQKHVDVPASLQEQIDNFEEVEWLHTNVFQTNKNSLLKYFKYRGI